MTHFTTNEQQRATAMPFGALAGPTLLDPASGNAMANWSRGCTTAISTAKRPPRHLGSTST